MPCALGVLHDVHAAVLGEIPHGFGVPEERRIAAQQADVPLARCGVVADGDTGVWGEEH